VEKGAIEKKIKQLVEVEQQANSSLEPIEDNILTLTPTRPTYSLLHPLKHNLNV
jgi:hypothetical protein